MQRSTYISDIWSLIVVLQAVFGTDVKVYFVVEATMVLLFLLGCMSVVHCLGNVLYAWTTPKFSQAVSA